MKRIILEILLVWGLFVALMFGLACAARGDDAPPPVTPTMQLMRIGLNCTQSSLINSTVEAAFMPVATVSINGSTTTVSAGPVVTVHWPAASTASISTTDTAGNTIWLPWSSVAAATMSIASQVVAANPTGN